MTSPYVTRLVDDELGNIVAEHPAVLLVGPRACGKTTTARRLSRSLVRLDVPAQAAVARADPDAAIRGLPEPVLIDEWQEVPEILGAVKRAVDDEPRPGRFILTGSSQTDLSNSGWPATGRIVRIAMYPLTGRERHAPPSGKGSWIDRVLRAEKPWRDGPVSGEWDLRSYLADALTSGWPEAVRAETPRARDRWLTGYLDHLVTREATAMGLGRNPARLRRYLVAVAANTAGTPAHKLLYDAAGISRETAVHYDGLLNMIFVADAVPPWSRNVMDRQVRTPKRYVVDAGLAAATLRVDLRAVMRDGNLVGRLLDTHVAAQLRADAAISEVGVEIFHLRHANGTREVDLLLESHDGKVIAVEVKAGSAPSRADARHLEWLRDRIGDDFVAGFVVHTGPRAFDLGDRIHAIPVAGLWA